MFFFLIRKCQVSIDILIEAFKHVVFNPTQFQKRRDTTFAALSGIFKKNSTLIGGSKRNVLSFSDLAEVQEFPLKPS